jgi:hypothetical protein
MLYAYNDKNEKITATPNQNAICILCSEEVISKCGTINVWHWAHKNNTECDSWSEGETPWHIEWKSFFPKENQEIVINKCVSEYCYNSKETTGRPGHAPCNHNDCVDCEYKKHIADIYINNKIIELQNSSISTEEIAERELFYNNMCWIFNGLTFAQHLEIRKKDDVSDIYTFRWKKPPKSLWFVNKEFYIDIQYLAEYNEILLKKLKDKLNIILDKIQNERKTNILYKIIFYDNININNLNNRIKKLETNIDMYKNKVFKMCKIYHNIPCGGYGKLIFKEELINKLKNNMR